MDGDPNGIRTRVTAVKGRCPGPLDDRVVQGERNMTVRARCAREKCAGTWSLPGAGSSALRVDKLPIPQLLAPDF